MWDAAVCAVFASERHTHLTRTDRRSHPDLCLRASAAYSSEAKAEARLTVGNASRVSERSSLGAMLFSAGFDACFSEKKAISMTTEKRNIGNAGRYRALPGAGPPQAASRILIAEDQPVIQDLLYSTLQLAGYCATVCGSRHAALTWRDQVMHSEDVSVVLLLDLGLLGTTEAIDFLNQVRTRWQGVGGVLPQVIALTTSAQVQRDLEPRERVLQKPFHIRDLILLIQQALANAARSEDGSEQANASLAALEEGI
jgi:CheY-like chemotaxis protein